VDVDLAFSIALLVVAIAIVRVIYRRPMPDRNRLLRCHALSNLKNVTVSTIVMPS
jgi:hypothetical protein